MKARLRLKSVLKKEFCEGLIAENIKVQVFSAGGAENPGKKTSVSA
jgi:hypothetical protein